MSTRQNVVTGEADLKRFHWGFFLARIGEWIYLIALNWLVLVRFESAAAVGIVNAARLLPVALVSMPSGLLADRHQSKSLMTWLYGLTSIFTILVAWSAWAGVGLSLLASFVFLRELFAGAEPPARNVLLSDLCPDNLPRTLASNATILNVGRILGPLVGGALIIRMELWSVLSLAALGSLACALQTARLKPAIQNTRTKGTKANSGMGEALTYVRQNPRLKLLIGMMIAPMFLAYPYLSLLPMISKGLLKCGPDGVGTLISLTALGSLASSATIVGNSKPLLRGSFQVKMLLLFSFALFLIVIAPNFTVAAIGAFLAGSASQAYRTVSRILAQMDVPDELRGRIVSLILMDRALIPIGTLFLTWCAGALGLLASGLVMAIGSGLATIVFLLVCPRIWNLTPATTNEQLLSPDRVLAPGPT